MCGFKAIPHKSNRRMRVKVDNVEFILLVQAFKGWQVLRLFAVHNLGRWLYGTYRTSVCVDEVRQQWLGADGESCMLSRRLSMYPYFRRNPFRTDSSFIVRRNMSSNYGYYSFNVADINIHNVIIQSLVDRFRYCGINKKCEYLSPYLVEKFVSAVLATRMSEPIIKNGNFELLLVLYNRGFFDNTKTQGRMEAALKVALRHGFFKKDMPRTRIIDWCDHIRMLIELGLDIHSPHYVAPSDFDAQHNLLFNRLSKIREAEKKKRKREQAIADEKNFIKMRKKFLGLVIMGENITIMPLHNIDEFFEEGDKMHNCVGSYRNKWSSLILSARIGKDWYNPEQRVMTIEVDLSQYKVVQARGFGNQMSDYNDVVLKLMNDNMELIKKLNESKCEENINVRIA